MLVASASAVAMTARTVAPAAVAARIVRVAAPLRMQAGEASPPLSSLDPEANRPRPAAPPVEAPAGTETLPPTSFLSLIEQAAAATEKALADGSRLLEVEFPPVPLSKLEDSAISAYDLLSANLQLVLEYAQRLNRVLNASPDQSIAITLPDAAERVRATEYLGDAEPAPGVRLWALSGGDAQPSPFGFLTSLVKSSDAAVEAAPWASAYIVLGVSCAELPSIRKLAELDDSTPIIAFNLKLDTLRGDLGLPGFPSKETHHAFLSRLKPVYYMRPRSYSLSLSRPPFLLSYQGVLFRCYPEGYQTLLDRGQGSYRRVCVQQRRPALGAFKAELTRALKVDDATAASAISQTGYKQSTWWEDDADGRDLSADWRS